MFYNSTETIGTLLTRIFFDVFLLFYANLTILLCWYLKFRFDLFLEFHVVLRYKAMIKLWSKLCIYYISGLFEFAEQLWQQN